MKVSLITTVKNEENNIREFLSSVIKQTKKPDEFIIVDGGSTDKTVEIIEKFSKRYKWIKLIKTNGVSIGKGRNIAINKAKNEIIACTDAGCVLDKRWLENITKPFLENKEVDVVAGIYQAYYTNNFEYFQGLIVVPEPEKITTPTRISSRSIAFKKKCWKKVKGYPDLNTGEDTMFNLKLKKAGFNLVFARDAVVFWRMRKSWKEFAKQFYRYGVGDKKAKNLSILKLNFLLICGFYFYLSLLLFGLFFDFRFFTGVFLLLLAYLLYFSLKVFFKTKKLSAFFYVPLLILIKRIFYVIGASVGK